MSKCLINFIPNTKIDHFYFVRHGRTDWNPEMLKFGPQDLHLNKYGIEEATQACEVIQRLSIKPDFIITSDLKRTIDTATILSKCHSLGKNDFDVVIDGRLNERSFGTWSDLYVKIEPLFKNLDVVNNPNFMRPFMKVVEENLPTDGETKPQFFSRVITDFADILEENIENEVVIVAHGEVRRAIQSGLKNVSAEEDFLSFGSVLKFDRISETSWEVYEL
jgi:broad specificity phosphatase PhoE